jgi:uncharacterized protein YkwD
MGSPPVGRRGLAVLVLTMTMLAFAPGAGARGYSASELRLVGMINQVRAAHVLPRLRIDATLERAARAHSQDMLAHGYFAHGPFVARLHSFGVHSSIVGENLAWGAGSGGEARSVLHLWLQSPEHRRNLLRPSFRRIGLGMPVGTFAGYRDTRMITADFAG